MSYWFLVSLPPLVVALAYGRAPFFAWYGVALAWLAALGWLAGWSSPTLIAELATVAVLGAVFLLPALRRSLVTAGIFRAFRKALPSMSQTEKDALEAGTVWWEGQLFAGKAQHVGRAGIARATHSRIGISRQAAEQNGEGQRAKQVGEDRQ